MKLQVELGGRSHTIEIGRFQARLAFAIDGAAVAAEAVEVAPGIYSILIANQSYEVRVEPFAGDLRIAVGEREFAASVRDPRKRGRNRAGSASSEGRQTITAPMPGRVVRVLVASGDEVTAGQGIVVVEAMKMQNEVRSPKQGKVEHLVVSEGQAINAGDTIAVIF
jgi:biotin carboxyl carrier protein